MPNFSKAIHSKNPLVRKGTRILLQIPRSLRRIPDAPSPGDAPPTLANSFPKSGTHLLDQIVEALPERRNYGSFLESMTASYVFRERARESTLKYIRSIIPGELVRAHLFYNHEYDDALQQRRIVHFFIFRDLRDVVVSEAHYLRSMNKWHRMHPHFRNCESQEDAISLAINGLPNSSGLYYPNVAERFNRFAGWLTSPTTFAVRFEDLTSEKAEDSVRKLVQWYAERTNCDLDIEQVTGAAIDSMNPGRSHTFRKSGSGGWKLEFTPRLKQEFKDVAGKLLAKLQYVDSFDW